MRGLERHPGTGGYGRWLNPLGRWDWWDLGGRFDGRIMGERGRAGRSASMVSSGPSPGRSILNNVEGALSDALGSPPANGVVVEADNNVELVAQLLEDARAGREHELFRVRRLRHGLWAVRALDTGRLAPGERVLDRVEQVGGVVLRRVHELRHRPHRHPLGREWF